MSVLVTGADKQDILGKLEESGGRGIGVVDDYPVLGVNPENGTLSWFVDYEAYFGRDYFLEFDG